MRIGTAMELMDICYEVRRGLRALAAACRSPLLMFYSTVHNTTRAVHFISDTSLQTSLFASCSAMTRTGSKQAAFFHLFAQQNFQVIYSLHPTVTL